MDICWKKHLDEGIIQKKGAAFYGFILWKNVFFSFIHPFIKKNIAANRRKKEWSNFVFFITPTHRPPTFIYLSANKKDNAVAEKEDLDEFGYMLENFLEEDTIPQKGEPF